MLLFKIFILAIFLEICSGLLLPLRPPASPVARAGSGYSIQEQLVSADHDLLKRSLGSREAAMLQGTVHNNVIPMLMEIVAAEAAARSTKTTTTTTPTTTTSTTTTTTERLRVPQAPGRKPLPPPPVPPPPVPPSDTPPRRLPGRVIQRPQPAAPVNKALYARLMNTLNGGGYRGGFAPYGRGNGFFSDDPRENAVGHDKTINDCGLGTVCDPNIRIWNLLAFPDCILAVGNQRIFKIGLDGVPTAGGLGALKDEFFASFNGTPTASLRTDNIYYIFFGDNVTTMDSSSNIIVAQMPIQEIFYGVRKPIKGAFRFNEHTLALFHEHQFGFYQPLANPPMDPRFSPQPTNIIPGGPDNIDGVVELNKSRYLYRDGWLYEISFDDMQAKPKIPLRRYKQNAPGWLVCEKYDKCFRA